MSRVTGGEPSGSRNIALLPLIERLHEIVATIECIFGSDGFDIFGPCFDDPSIPIMKPCGDLPCILDGSESHKDVLHQRQRLIGRIKLVARKVLLASECDTEDFAASLP